MPWLQEPTFKISSKPGYWTVVTSGVWQHPNTKEKYNVPAGLRTNFASVPRIFWSYVDRMGRSRYPALLHDKHYGDGMDRKKADELFKLMLIEEGMRRSKAKLLYRALRMFGGIHLRLNS